MQLQINEQPHLDRYIRSIREWLMSRGRQPKARGHIADPYGTSSLLFANAQKFRKVPGASPRWRVVAPPGCFYVSLDAARRGLLLKLAL